MMIKREKEKYIKGITMIALVITIIVLLILAGVTIAAISGDNGVISNANEAEIKTGLSELKEKISLYEIQTEGAHSYDNVNYIDKMEQEGIIIKITTEENIKLAIIKDKDKLNFASRLGDAGKDVSSDYVGKMTDLNNVYAIGIKNNDVYYIIDGKIWSIQGIISIEDLKEAELIRTATFDGNGGSHGGTITKKIGEPLGTLPTSVRSGYTFNGWYTQKIGGERITNETIMPGADLSGENVTYYAQWTKDGPVITTANYTVKHYQQALDGSYPSIPTETQSLTGTIGTSIIPGVKNYTGFTSPATKTATIASNGSTVVEYQYVRNSYILTLNKNENIASATGRGTYKYGQSVSINATLGSTTGYTHTWTNWTSSNTSLQPNISTQSATITMPAGNITLTANANKTVNRYTATFNGNGGANGGTITKNYGEQLGALPTSTKEGYKFSGWFTAISGGVQITEKTTMPAQSITYYAQWKDIEAGEWNGKVNTPKISDGMIPIKWDNAKSKWVVCSRTDTNWYNYIDQSSGVDQTSQWANVMLSDGAYKANTVSVGQEVEESQLGSMFVWIPRYAYSIESGYHTTTAGTIKIAFLEGRRTYETGAEVSYSHHGTIGTATLTNASGQGNWNEHPAFNYGGTIISGIWVAKFQASSSDPSIKFGGGDTTNLDIKSLPSITAWRDIRIENSYINCINMNKTGNPYELNTDDTIVDPHLLKNMEWGAIAYLAHSSYGRNTNRIAKNNSMDFITGNSEETVYESPVVGISNTYDTNKGVLGSTTGNITGIYDTNPAAIERVAGYMEDGGSHLMIYGTALVNSKNVAHKDVYESRYELLNERYGDAVYETSSEGTGNGKSHAWNDNYSNYISTNGPFFVRGGNYNQVKAGGIFNFDAINGYADSYGSFRPSIVVL